MDRGDGVRDGRWHTIQVRKNAAVSQISSEKRSFAQTGSGQIVKNIEQTVQFVSHSLAGHAHNDSTGVSSFNFHSIDLNAYLYKEKRTLAAMATALGNSSGAKHWTAEADALLPRLQAYFFKPDDSATGGGFFQDRYFNGTFVPVQVCTFDLEHAVVSVSVRYSRVENRSFAKTGSGRA
jgi:hypothetical protein